MRTVTRFQVLLHDNFHSDGKKAILLTNWTVIPLHNALPCFQKCLAIRCTMNPVGTQRWLNVISTLCNVDSVVSTLVMYTTVFAQVRIISSFSGHAIPVRLAGGSVRCASDWWSGGRRFDLRRVRKHSLVEIDLEIFSTFIFSHPLIQVGQFLAKGCAQYWLTA